MKESEYFITPGLHENIKRFSILVRSLLKDDKARPKPIIILGPSGAGKSSFVEAFKNIFSKERKTKKVLSLNCAEYDGELVRAELFGYVKGAFTGATGDKDGLLKEADGGILVLEEIGELSKDVQAKLLIALEKGEYLKVGGTKKETIKNLAIVATTNQGQDSFRPDFWYRCYPIYVSPLHKRKVDILFYLNKKHPEVLRKIDLWELLRILSYNWPGNFREVDNMVLSINAKHEFNGQHGGSVLPGLSRKNTNAALVDLWNVLTQIIPQKDLAKIRKYFLKFNFELNPAGSKRKLIGRLPKVTCYRDEETGLDILDEDRALHKIYHGFINWCDLFSIHPHSEEDCLDKIYSGYFDNVPILCAPGEIALIQKWQEEIKRQLPVFPVNKESEKSLFYKNVPILLKGIDRSLDYLSKQDQAASKTPIEEKQKIEDALKASGGNKAKAARSIDMKASTFDRRMKRYKLSAKKFGKA
jgi:transcriptional regulator with AAA-type ATPase domain